MIIEADIKDAVQDYLAGASFSDFEEWLASQSWNMHRDSEPGAQQMVSSIQVLIAEFGYGHLSEIEFKNHLAERFGNSISLSVDVPVSPRPRFSTRSRSIVLPQAAHA